MATRAGARAEELLSVPEEGKAELVGGNVVQISPTGFLPSCAAAEVFSSLREYARRTRSGYAFPDNTGFLVDLPNRQSLSPDAAYFVGQPS